VSEPVLADEYAPRPLVRSVVAFEGGVWNVMQDVVDLGEAGVVIRDYVEHPGAVAVLALDDDDRVLLVRQYRHPVRSLCWELPAGLRDVEGEPLAITALRELEEETAHTAATWFELLDYETTPGGSSERLAIFLARDVMPLPEASGFEPEGEEVDMEVAWFGFDEVVDAVLAGRVRNPSLVAGILAASVHRAEGYARLRPAAAG